MENDSIFFGLDTVKGVIEYLDRIERFKEITFENSGNITYLKGLPRGFDFMFALRGYIMPEMMDYDWEEGVLYIKHTPTGERRQIRFKIDDLHELHTAVMSLIRKMYLKTEFTRQSILNIY